MGMLLAWDFPRSSPLPPLVTYSLPIPKSFVSTKPARIATATRGLVILFFFCTTILLSQCISSLIHRHSYEKLDCYWFLTFSLLILYSNCREFYINNYSLHMYLEILLVTNQSWCIVHFHLKTMLLRKSSYV